MTDEQASRLEAIAQQQEPFFLLRVIRVVDQAGVLVKKNSLRLLEGDALFYLVGLSLAAVPVKRNIAQSIILAISLIGADYRAGSCR
jgi:hypothetical protein